MTKFGIDDHSEIIRMGAEDDPQETIQLDQFLKLCQAAETGGQAKLLIQAGEVLVNGEVETRRRRKLRHGDQVECEGEIYVIETD